MAQSKALQSMLAEVSISSIGLYKPDRPRWIDHYIDFFGDGTPARLSGADPCGEAVLDWSA